MRPASRAETLRKSALFIALLTGGVAILASLLFIHPVLTQERHLRAVQIRKDLVRELELTDLSLFTEARYTRHLSQADLHSAFQDHPLAFEHFPSGSLVLPPVHLFKRLSSDEMD